MKKDHVSKPLSRKVINRYEQKQAKKLKKAGVEDFEDMSVSINQLERLVGKEGRKDVFENTIATMRNDTSLNEDVKDYIRNETFAGKRPNRLKQSLLEVS